MNIAKRLRLCWHAWSTRRKMNRVFSRREDPYGYDCVPYELERLSSMQAAVRDRRWRHALELGCAEGAFTALLAAGAERVTAVDISPVALERARRRLARASGIEWVCADIRAWEPADGARADLVVLGDVLYYLDKPGIQDEFDAVFARIAGWLEPGGRLLSAHGFAGEGELKLREGYRRRFQRLGLRLLSESVVGRAAKEGDVRCLLSALRKI